MKDRWVLVSIDRAEKSLELIGYTMNKEEVKYIREGNEALVEGKFNLALYNYICCIIKHDPIARVAGLNARRCWRASAIRQTRQKQPSRIGVLLGDNSISRERLENIVKFYADGSAMPSAVFANYPEEATKKFQLTDSGISIFGVDLPRWPKISDDLIKQICNTPFDLILIPKASTRVILLGLLYNIIWGAAVRVFSEFEEAIDLVELLNSDPNPYVNGIAGLLGDCESSTLVKIAWHLRSSAHSLLEDVHRKALVYTKSVRAPETVSREHFYEILCSGLFDPDWYSSTYSIDAAYGNDLLAHYINIGEGLGHSASKSFNVKKYLKNNPDVTNAPICKLMHFACWGAKEGRLAEERVTIPAQELQQLNIIEERFYQYGEFGDPQNHAVQAIAFYLPQFHAIPENDKWWGTGFTEWSNTKRATQYFSEHFQPRVPIEPLGYYSLSDVNVYAQQVQFARQAGLYGFCFHFYWFGGTTLLERPLRNMLGRPDIDFPFCLCWANENWTRRWDGQESEVLISQKHSDEDSIALLQYLNDYFSDNRYIKINNRPVLVIYRPAEIPNISSIQRLLRKEAQKLGYPDLYLVMAQTFGKSDPTDIGFDAAVQFPPHNSYSNKRLMDEVSWSVTNFCGQVNDYETYAVSHRDVVSHEYKIFKCVTLGWDNTARRRLQGTIFHKFTLNAYANWLYQVASRAKNSRTLKAEEKIVFINAWNEWGEGTYLEPDERYGFGYLEATRRALALCGEPDNVPPRSSKPEKDKVLLVIHDANYYGAQLLTLNILKSLTSTFGIEVHTLCLSGGPLVAKFRKWGKSTVLDDTIGHKSTLAAFLSEIKRQGYRKAICNTIVSASISQELHDSGILSITLLHELPGTIKQFKLGNEVARVESFSTLIVSASPVVASGFDSFLPAPSRKHHILPQGLYKRTVIRSAEAQRSARKVLREKLGLSATTQVVLGVGHVDVRKGVDLFVKIAELVISRSQDAIFLWVGRAGDLTNSLNIELSQDRYAVLKGRLIFHDFSTDTDLLYGGADVFAMTSREDPFPSVVLEAMDSGLPIVTFRDSGGAVGIIESIGGKAVPMLNVDEFAAQVLYLLQNESVRATVGAAGRRLIETEYNFGKYCHDLLTILSIGPKKVSVIVPNYNYAHYIKQRLDSILNQSIPAYEIIILDDCSTDGSALVIKEFCESRNFNYQLLINETNSGSVFSQWKRGADIARGDFIWIAEADDLSEPDFLAEAIRGFDDSKVVLSYTESKQIDVDGSVTCENYLDYVNDVSEIKWRHPYISDGVQEIEKCLAIKNTIPNVSAVVFRHHILQKVLAEHISEMLTLKIAGDWLCYVEYLRFGKIAFSPKSLNLHRRHRAGVTLGHHIDSHLDEIDYIQKRVDSTYPACDVTRHKARMFRRQAEGYLRSRSVE